MYLTALDRNLSARTDELGAINSNISANEQVTDYLKSDQYVEKEARENHGLVNEGDKVFSAE